jgi:adenine phosphoribosyltransferase
VKPEELRDCVRDIADFPKPGVTFKDITPLLSNTDAFRSTIDLIADHFEGQHIDRVLGVEARGFIIAAPVAYKFGAAFVPVRKAGKLPWEIERVEYELEYGTDLLEIVDDVLATGGTAAATVRLVEKLGGTVAGLAFVIELEFLKGRQKLDDLDLVSLITY